MSEWGVQDSKVYGSNKKGKLERARLARLISEQFNHRIIVISPQTVDQFVTESSLNNLEQVTAGKIIDNLSADRVILDGATLFAPLVKDGVIAENKADQTYLSVAAASVLAKAERDRQFKQICERYLDSFGEIKGGGYANRKTLEFVKWYLAGYGELPAFYRKSYHWKALNGLS